MIYYVADFPWDAIPLSYYSWCRKRLFNMINELPTIFEIVSGTAKKQSKEKSSVSNHSGNKSKSNSKAVKGFPLYNAFIWWRKLQYICGQSPLSRSGLFEGNSTELCFPQWEVLTCYQVLFFCLTIIILVKCNIKENVWSNNSILINQIAFCHFKIRISYELAF